MIIERSDYAKHQSLGREESRRREVRAPLEVERRRYDSAATPQVRSERILKATCATLRARIWRTAPRDP